MMTKEADPQDDARCVRTILSGTREEKEEGFRRLMVKYWRIVAVLAANKVRDRREAEDITQEAFLRAFRSLHQLAEPVAFLGWLLRIARNLATDYLRTRKHTVPLAVASDAARYDSIESLLESEEEAEQLLEAVDALPDKYREVITLKYMQGLDGKAMARLLGEPEGTVRNRLFRAIERLRTRLVEKKDH